MMLPTAAWSPVGILLGRCYATVLFMFGEVEKDRLRNRSTEIVCYRGVPR
jgi:hypothetical protein